MKLQPWQVTIIEAHAQRLYHETGGIGRQPVDVYCARFKQFLEAIIGGDATPPPVNQMEAALRDGQKADTRDLAVVLGNDLAQFFQSYLAQRGLYQKDEKFGCTSLVERDELAPELAEKLIPMIKFVRGEPL